MEYEKRNFVEACNSRKARMPFAIPRVRRHRRLQPLDRLAPSVTVDSMTEPKYRDFCRAALPILLVSLTSPMAFGDVSHGTPEAATNYYRGLSKELGFSTPDNIFASTLDTVALYLGYDGITGADLQNL